MSLLPPNATPLERAMERATARIGAIDTSAAASLWDPWTCPIDALPWLAWSLSVDDWDAAWPEATKRRVVADAILLHRRKGTRGAVDMTLARLDELLGVVEWHEADPPLDPHTFDVILPLIQADGTTGGARATAAFADRVIAAVEKMKPLREHMTMVQHLPVAAPIGVVAAARVLLAHRAAAPVVTDTSQPWATFLQTEDGEPLQSEDGAMLAHTS